MKYSIGIDIGGTNTALGLVDERGTIIQRYSLITKYFDDVDFFLDQIISYIKDLISCCEDKDNIVGIGIGAPNANFYKGTIEHAPNLNFKGIIPIKQILDNKLKQSNIPLDVIITNDANAATIGEMTYGGAKGVKNFIFITLGTGVGSGIVIDGKLVYGHDGFAGELGHSIVIHQGRICNCGRRGCLETYSSATGIVKTAKDLIIGSKTESVLRQIKEEDMNSKIICDSALNGDFLALRCFEITAKVLAIGLANAVTISSPEKIFIFGGLTKAGDILINPLKRYFEENLFVVYKDKISIELSHLKENDAAILGAASLVL